MSDHRYPGDIRRDRVPLRVRKAGDNRYRVTDEAGRGLQDRKRADFSADALKAIDVTSEEEVLLEGWLNRFGRWSVTGRLGKARGLPKVTGFHFSRFQRRTKYDVER